MDTSGPYLGLLVALGIGLVIGLEREQSMSNEPPADARMGLGGPRTSPSIARAVALSMILSKVLRPWTIALLLAGLIAIVLVGFVSDVNGGRDRGITSEIAMVITFLIGALTVTEGI